MDHSHWSHGALKQDLSQTFIVTDSALVRNWAEDTTSKSLNSGECSPKNPWSVFHPFLSSWFFSFLFQIEEWSLQRIKRKSYTYKGLSLRVSAYQLVFQFQKRLIMDLPAKSKYIRACMKSFWELNIQLDLKHENTLRHIGAEPLFYNSRFNLHTTQANREYFTTVTNASIISDIMNDNTNTPFTYKNGADSSKTQMRNTPRDRPQASLSHDKQ